MPANAIEIRGVTKRYGTFVAVDDLSLAVPAGSIYGFIGPNGSGKTTTLRMIMNILLPDRGEISVLGGTGTRAARDGVGYLPEERGLYPKMEVRRLLRYFGSLKGARGAALESSITSWLGRLGLSEWAEKKVEQLSKGMQQKVQFLAAIVAEPSLVLLDEPFSGLDPVNAEVLKDAVLSLRERGTTVVFSTHDMAVAEKMCDRIFMIFRGRKVLDGSLEEIQATHGKDTIRVRTAGGASLLRGMPGVTAVNDYGQLQEVKIDCDPQAFLQRLAQATRVDRYEIARPSLHEIFVAIAKPDVADVPRA